MSRPGPISRFIAAGKRPAESGHRPHDVRRRHLEKWRAPGSRHADCVYRISFCVSVPIRRVSPRTTTRQSSCRRPLPSSNPFRLSNTVFHRNSEEGLFVSGLRSTGARYCLVRPEVRGFDPVATLGGIS